MRKLIINKKIIIILADAVLATLALFVPKLAAIMINNIPSCPFAKMGILCPACGGTRCVQSFFSGRISDAFSYNAFFTVLIFYTFAIIILANLYCLFDVKRLKGILEMLAGYKAVIAGAVVFAIFGFVRAIVSF